MNSSRRYERNMDVETKPTNKLKKVILGADWQVRVRSSAMNLKNGKASVKLYHMVQDLIACIAHSGFHGQPVLF